MGLVVMVACTAVRVMVVVVGICSPLVYGQRLFTGVVVVGVCSPLVFGVVGWWWYLLAFGMRPAFVRWHGGWLVFVCLWFWCGWLVVGVFLAFGVRPAFVRWRGGGWCLFAFGFGVVGWWWRLLACGGPVFARWDAVPGSCWCFRPSSF